MSLFNKKNRFKGYDKCRDKSLISKDLNKKEGAGYKVFCGNSMCTGAGIDR